MGAAHPVLVADGLPPLRGGRYDWSELNGDLWTIPAARYKTATEVTLPLSKAAMKVLAEIPAY